MARGRAAIPDLLLVAAFLTATIPARADEARVIQLKHRPASEVMPLIRPLLGPDDALSGTGFRLILRSSDRKLKEIERVLAQVDVERRRLRITVEQTAAGDRTAMSQSVTGEARIGDKARVVLPGRPSDEGGLVVQKDGLRYQANRRTTGTSGANTQTILTQDGQRAYIRVGQSVPHVRKILALSRRQLVLMQDIQLHDVTTGFEVLPRVRGDRVLVEITPRLASLKDPATGLADFQGLTTTVETELGEWLDLGEILENRGDVERAILESASAESGERRTVLLKVE
jgi:type II secretory pathway component GspD/PulD (secretin)